LFTLTKTVSFVSDAATATNTSQASILMLCVCQTLIKALLTYLVISNPGIPGSRDWKFLYPGSRDWENSHGITNSTCVFQSHSRLQLKTQFFVLIKAQ